MSNTTALAALRGRIERLRSIPLTLPEIARRAAVELEAVIARNIAMGLAPDGSRWPATKDGHAPLRDAMKSITVAAHGSEVVILVDGVEARHHLGAVKGNVKRELIPTRAIPQPMLEALDRVTHKVLAEHMDGAR